MKAARKTRYRTALPALFLFMGLTVVTHALSLEEKRMQVAAAREALLISETSREAIQEELA